MLEFRYISLRFVPKGLINNIPALVQIMAWHRPGDKPLSEPMMVNLLTHIYASPGLNELTNNNLLSLHHQGHISVKFESKFRSSLSRKCMQKMSSATWWPYCPGLSLLTHWGRVTHICIAYLTIIASDNGLSPSRRQSIIWTNAEILLIRPLGTNVSEMLIEIHTFSFKKMHLKMTSAKRRAFCLGLNVLTASPSWWEWGYFSSFFDIEMLQVIWNSSSNNREHFKHWRQSLKTSLSRVNPILLQQGAPGVMKHNCMLWN